MNSGMKNLGPKLYRVLTGARLRATQHRKPIDLDAWMSDFGIKVNRALDLGSGPAPRNPFGASFVYGVDIRAYDLDNDVRECRIGVEPLPFETGYFDVLTAYDVLEHIPRVAFEKGETRFPFVFAMNEMWRVLRVGGVFYSSTPCYPMKEAFQDPTHVNIMTEDTLRLYFSEKNWARIYGYKGSFRLVDEGWVGSHYFCALQKTSDESIDGINASQER